MRKFEGFMHGINLGGWLSQKDSNRREYVNAFITENDIAEIARIHLDHIRIPLDYSTLEEENGTPIEEGYEHIDRAIEWCRKYGLHVVLNLHNTHGYDFSPYSLYSEKPVFFYDTHEQERFFSLWEKIASRYASDHDIVALEMLNEMILPDVSVNWKLISDEAYKRVRMAAPDTWIVIGGVHADNQVHYPLIDTVSDDHMVINLNCFEPMVFTHQKAYWVDHMPMDLEVPYPDTAAHYCQISEKCHLGGKFISTMKALPPDTKGKDIFEKIFAPAIDTAEQHDMPLYCSGYGVDEFAPIQDTIDWFADISSVFDEHGIGRALWNYKAEDFGLMDEAYDELRDAVVKYL